MTALTKLLILALEAAPDPDVMEQATKFVDKISGFVWDWILLFLLLGAGLFLTIRTRFIQVRRFGVAWHRVFGNFSLKGSEAGKGGMSSFQALATAIAAQVGTGNIAGCATAIVGGGPGAIFWMWLAAFFGMATIYGEACLAQATRITDKDGELIGGPVYYITKAFKGGFGKFMAAFFSIAIIMALGFMGNMVQSNSISAAFKEAFNIPTYIVGVLVAIVGAFIFLGGIKRIASFTEKVVPIMAAFYLVGGLVLLIINYKNVPGAIASIFEGAFTPDAVCGGLAGIAVREAIRKGVARGLFSNEAGMGSTPHAHAIAKVDKPQHQGEVAMVGVFIDTFIVLNMTALTILSTGVLNGQYGEQNKEFTGTVVAQTAFSHGFGGFGSGFVAICLLFFAFSTIIGWYFFGRQNIKYLFGEKGILPYTIIVIACILVGSLLKVNLVWSLSDFFNALMVLPNAIALLALSGFVAKFAKGENVKM